MSADRSEGYVFPQQVTPPTDLRPVIVWWNDVQKTITLHSGVNSLFRDIVCSGSMEFLYWTQLTKPSWVHGAAEQYPPAEQFLYTVWSWTKLLYTVIRSIQLSLRTLAALIVKV